MAKPQILTLQDIHYALSTDLVIASTTNGSAAGGYKKLTYNPETELFKGWKSKDEPTFHTRGRRQAIQLYNLL